MTKLEELATLQEGWLDGEGLPPHPAALANAEDLLARIQIVMDEDAAVFPIPDGGVQIEWGQVSVDCLPDGKYGGYCAHNAITTSSREIILQWLLSARCWR